MDGCLFLASSVIYNSWAEFALLFLLAVFKAILIFGGNVSLFRKLDFDLAVALR